MHIIYLIIEFLDELVFGVGEVALPLMRDDLALTYTQIGLLLSLPGIIAAFIEPFIGILGDVWKRRVLIITGGILFTLSLFMTSASNSFFLLLASFILFFPSSGAFVSLSQASLMDSAPGRHEQNMARWTFAGSLGVLTGPLLLGLFVYFGLGWRGTYATLASFSGLCLLAALRALPPDPIAAPSLPSFRGVFNGFRAAFQALRRKEVWRWLLMLEFADLMMDVLFSYLALYFVDVAQASEGQAAFAVTIWLAMGLATDFLFIPFLDRQKDSLRYVRITALIELFAFILFLLVPGFLPKLVVVIFVNLLNTGWYPVLQGRLYSSLPGQSASIMAIGSVTAPLAKMFPFVIGLVADQSGLQSAMWILALGPLALFIGLPRSTSRPAPNLLPFTLIMPPYSLYFHIPFCTHRCAYCDFNTYAGQEELIPAYVDALCKDIEFVGSTFPSPDLRGARGVGQVHTIFFGGGTPSLLTPKQFELIFESIRSHFSLMDDTEITIEANPGTCSFADLLDLHSVGINRISFGVQSANPSELRMLERAHNFFDVIEAVTSARKAGFSNLNLDLIYGLPEQTLQSWQVTVQRILDLRPEHISAYALTLEHGTPFGRWSARGLLPIPDPDLAAEMYEWLGETLEANGYIQYEISNWAKQKSESSRQGTDRNYSFACRHNLQYWRSLPYLAFGAGAHGYAHGYRYSNVLRIKTYIDRLSNINHQISKMVFPHSPVTVNLHKQTRQDDLSDYMINNLRLVQAGVSEEDFVSRFGSGLMDVYPVEIQELVNAGLLEWNEDSIRLTRRGRLLGNRVFMRFVD